jgi:hypothetical protein
MESMERDLGFVSLRIGQRIDQITYAQTWVPVSGMMVKRTESSSSLTQATLPKDDSDAVNSVDVC